MGKGTTKNTSNLGLVQPQQRSLRSRKREFPEDKINQSSNNQTKDNPRDTDTNSSTSAALAPCLPQPAQQEATKLSTPHQQREKQAIDSGQEALTSCLAVSVSAEPVMDKAMKDNDCEKLVLTGCIEASVLENLAITQLSDHIQDKAKEGMEMGEYSRPSSNTPMDQRVSVFVACKVDDAEGCTSLCHTGQLEEDNGGYKTQINKCSQQGSDLTYKADNLSNEPAVGMPSKRRRRMGMCGLTEKERSHFLQTQTQMCENGKEQRDSGEKRVEDGGFTGDGNMELKKDKPCSGDDEESNVVLEEANFASVLNSPSAQSILVGPFTNQSEVEKEPLPHTCEAVDRTEVHTFVTASDKCSDSWNQMDRAPVHTEVKTDEKTSPSKDCGQGTISDIYVNCHTESAGSKVEPEKQENLTDVEDTFEEPHHLPTTVSATSPLHNVPIESDPDHREGDQASQQPMDSLARIPGLSEMAEMAKFRHRALSYHLSIDPGLGQSEGIGEQLRTEATAPPSGAEENGNSGLYDDGGSVSLPVATQHALARVTPDLFGSFDYISDSQLHNINLIEEQGGLVEDGGLCSSHYHEDGTDLVHGLIRELSSLNRIVMATQRKVENLRRGNRGPKAY